MRIKLPRISLADKYRILFGSAVLLILTAALSVPWTLLSTLVYQQPYREAQRIADDYFRLILPERSRQGGVIGGIHGAESALMQRAIAEPRFIRARLNPTDPESIAAPGHHEFVLRAFKRFWRQPDRTNFWQNIAEDGTRRFYYAHAVRVTRSCLSCHDEGRGPIPYQDGELAGVIALTLPADVSDEQVVFYRAWLIAAGILAGVLAILVFYLITRNFILSPIDELRSMAARVTAGDLEVRSQLETGDEFEQLSESLNTMLERLRSSQEELRRANKALDRKLGEIAESNVALYEANRVKSEFLANVTHELRTPLTSIIGFAELLRENPEADPNSRNARFAENILISGRILLEIVNDLLDLAKIEANKVDLSIGPLRVDELCSTLVDFMSPQADRKRIQLVGRVEPGLPLVYTDSARLRQILLNLLSNAVKFTPEEGLVTLSVGVSGPEHVLFEVIDSGPGVAPEHQQMIFDKFRQVDQSKTRVHQGTGLGLAISRELTELLGGKIGVESELGSGSRFWVRLPVGQPSDTAIHQADRPPTAIGTTRL